MNRLKLEAQLIATLGPGPYDRASLIEALAWLLEIDQEQAERVADNVKETERPPIVWRVRGQERMLEV